MKLMAAVTASLCLALAGCGDTNEAPADDTLQTEPSDVAPTPENPGPAAAAPPATSAPAPAPAAQRVDTPVLDGQGNEAGTLAVEPADEGVRFTLHVENLPPGEHAVHVHETGVCEPPFESAGAHFGAPGSSHGDPTTDPTNPQARHWGDMPNQQVDEDGVLDAEIDNGAVALADSGPGALRDHDGSALVVHAQPDDYTSQPSGAAGDRIACAVIAPPRDAG